MYGTETDDHLLYIVQDYTCPAVMAEVATRGNLTSQATTRYGLLAVLKQGGRWTPAQDAALKVAMANSRKGRTFYQQVHAHYCTEMGVGLTWRYESGTRRSISHVCH